VTPFNVVIELFSTQRLLKASFMKIDDDDDDDKCKTLTKVVSVLN